MSEPLKEVVQHSEPLNAPVEPKDEPKQQEPQEGSEQQKSFEWFEAEIKKLREENASRRVKARELEEALSKAKTIEEFTAAMEDNSNKTVQLERELVAAIYKLPESLAKRLQGSTREELEADAKQLAEDAKQLSKGNSQPGEFLSGGMNPSNEQVPDVKGAVDRVRRSQRIF